MSMISVIHALAGLIVLAEALRRLEHAKPAGPGLTWRQRGIQALCALAWLALAVSAALAVAGPALGWAGPPICWAGIALSMGPPSVADVLVLSGAAGVVLSGWLERLS